MKKNQIMTIKEFLDKYGRDTTTNFELIQIAKELGLKIFYYCMKDEIKQLRRILKKTFILYR